MNTTLQTIRSGGAPGVRARRRTGLAVIGAACAIAALAIAVRPFAAPVGAAGAHVDPAVHAALASAPEAAVVVALDVPPAPAGAPEPLHVLRGRVASAQARALSGLPDREFRVTQRYAHIEALAGYVTAPGLARLADQPGIAAIALDPPLELHLDSSVPFIGADRVRRSGTTGEGVRVAVLDTGIDTGHLDLRAALVEEACFITPDTLCPSAPHVAEDSDGHGTHVAGIVASRGRKSSYGVAPGAEIVAVKLIEERNNAAGSSTLAVLNWIIARDDIDVINMSFGSGAYDGVCDDANGYTIALARAFDRLRADGVMAVGSSGNDGSPTKMGAPACIESVVSVGAIVEGIGPSSVVADFTNRNETIDLLAPGVEVESSFLAGRTQVLQGTSMAAPHVAGAIALLMEAVPWAGPDDIEAALEDTGGRPTLRFGGRTVSTIKVDSALRRLEDLPSPTATAPVPPTATPEPPTATPSPTSSPPPLATATITPTPPPTAVPSQTPTVGPTRTATAGPEAPPPVYLPAVHRGAPD